MCKFCSHPFETDEGPYNLFRYDPDNMDLINLDDCSTKTPDIKLFISGAELFAINRQGLNEGVVPIIFCPICGEKLRNEVAIIPL